MSRTLSGAGVDLFSMQGRTVIVTGGLGQLGQRFTQALVERGAHVAVFDLARPRRASQRRGPELRLQVDVTDRRAIARALRTVIATWGVPHGLVNCAALDAPPDASAKENGPFEQYPEGSWDRIMAVNAKGAFLCCQEVGGSMANAGRGSIVNISSIYGAVSPDQRIYSYRRSDGMSFFKPAAYGSSKAALANLTRYLATYWARQNVRVNTLSFGGVFNGQDPRFVRAYSSRVPIGRMAKPDEYSGAVVFLLSEASSYMTGSNLVIDGGWTAW